MSWRAVEPDPKPPTFNPIRDIPTLAEQLEELRDRIEALEAIVLANQPEQETERRTYPATVNPETGAVSVDLGPQKVTATMLRAEQETRADA